MSNNNDSLINHKRFESLSFIFKSVTNKGSSFFKSAFSPPSEMTRTLSERIKAKELFDTSTVSNIWENILTETRQEKGKVCFGSGLERKTLESDMKGLVSRHARSNMKENNVVLGPGKYDFSSQISAMSTVLNKPTSALGTVLGGRTAERKGPFSINALNPAPGEYNIPTTFPLNYRQSCAPFNTGAERGKIKTQNVPGVGIYNVAPHKSRTTAFANTFGGKKCLLPAVKMKCGPFNFDTCEICKKFPEGDYWSLDTLEAKKISKGKKEKQADFEGVFLCRGCYDMEKTKHKVFTTGQMKNFKKIRDCSKIHFHDGCKAKLFLVSPQEIAKLNVREAYLSLYFS